MKSTSITSLWEILDQASRKRSPFNFLQLATIGLDGTPRMRTIVLRGCDMNAGSLSFVTDMRSPKIEEIGRDSRVSIIGYDPLASMQLRLSGLAALVLDNSVRMDVWQTLRRSTLEMFETDIAPSTTIDESDRPLHPSTSDHPSIGPYDRYALVSVVVSQLECLDLSSQPHARNLFSRVDGVWYQTRLAP